MLHGYNKIYYKSKVHTGTYKLSDNNRKLMEHYISHKLSKELLGIVSSQLKRMQNQTNINHISVVRFANELFLMLKRYCTGSTVMTDEKFMFMLHQCDRVIEVEKFLRGLFTNTS